MAHSSDEIASSAPVLDRFQKPVAQDEQRWLNGLYRDTPEDMDHPYSFFQW